MTRNQKAVIFLDEISWMGSKDKDFAGKLKGVWDTKFKQNNRLLLIICGSVTSWIDKNIVENKGFVGRVSLTITLEELPLYDANLFWKQTEHISAFEKFKILCGVPRYLEEINTRESAENNIKRTCFTKKGFLYSEFDQIFRDIFSHQGETYRKVVESLASGPLEPSAIAKKLGKTPTGGLSRILHVLEISGFIRRDFSWNLSGRNGARSKYRIHDNYIRFWLKYIKPAQKRIEKGLLSDLSLENLKGWETILGLQFEALILNNLPHVLSKLRIPLETVENAGPYFQKETKRMKGCQIDLLISTRYSEYICEIKYRKKVGSDVITEVEEKIQKLKVPNTKSIRPVLIYLGELSGAVQKSDLFTHFIPADDMLIKK
jgi:AAA+ ATPase superfamily predicted ATPase